MTSACARLWCLLSCALQLASCSWLVGGDPSEPGTDRHLLADGTSLQYARFSGLAAWNVLPALFDDRTVNVTCPDSKPFGVYVASSLQVITSQVEAKQSAWCGWTHYLGSQPQSCSARVPTVGDSIVAAARPKTGFFTGKECTFQYSSRPSPRMILQLAVGLLLFHNAGFLTQQTAFRLSTGSLTFALLSFIFLVVMLGRVLPSKRSIAAVFTACGWGGLRLAKGVFGTYLPSLQQLAQHPVMLGYFAVSALAGLAVTYYYDSPQNHKLMTILKVGLQLLALLLIVTSTNIAEASVAIAVLAIAWKGVSSAEFAAWAGKGTWGDMLSRKSTQLNGKSNVHAPELKPAPSISAQLPQPPEPAGQPLPAEAGTQPHVSAEQAPAALPAADDMPDAAAYIRPSSPSMSQRVICAAKHAASDFGLSSQSKRGDDQLPIATLQETQLQQQLQSPPLVQRERFSFRSFAKDGLQQAAAVPLPAATWAEPRTPSGQSIASADPSHTTASGGKSYVTNEQTGRAIAVGGRTYTQLLQQGYQVDLGRNTITPPGKGAKQRADSPASTSRRRRS